MEGKSSKPATDSNKSAKLVSYSTTNTFNELEIILNNRNRLDPQKKKENENQINSYIITAASKQLEEIITENMEDQNAKYIKKDIFYLNPPPKITIQNFLKGILRATDIDISTLVCGVIYLDRMCDKRRYVLCYNNIHLLLLASCILSMKFNEDLFVTNLNLAEFHGVHVSLINQIEYEMYALLDFNLYIEENLFKKYYVYFYKIGKKRLN